MTYAVAFHGLTLGYDRHPAVHRLDGKIVEGSLTAIVGPNGAGKEPWGDRRQEIVFIGTGIDWPRLKARLDAALLTAHDALGPDALPDLPDPFPVWRRQAAA